MSKVKPIPEGYETITPYLAVSDGEAAIEFYKKAFDAREIFRMPNPNGKGVGHADLLLFGRMHLMLSEEAPDMGHRSPRTLGGTPVMLQVYVDDADAAVARAVDAGAKLTRPVEDQFYGDRGGGIEDPFGHSWFISTHIEDVPAEDMGRRAAEKYGKS